MGEAHIHAVANKLQRPIMVFSDGVSTRHLYMYKPDYPVEGWDVVAKEDVKTHLKTDALWVHWLRTPGHFSILKKGQ